MLPSWKSWNALSRRVSNPVAIAAIRLPDWRKLLLLCLIQRIGQSRIMAEQKPEPGLKLYPVKFDKAKLANVPPDERVVYFTLAQMANDIFMLQRATLIYLQAPEDEKGLISYARTSTALMFAQLLAGKLFEACSFLQREPAHSKLVPDYAREMGPEGIEGLECIRRRSDTMLQDVRRKLAFHYDIDVMRAAYESYPANEQFVEYFAQAETNSFYQSAAQLTAFGVLHVSNKTDLRDALNRLMDEVLAVSRWVKDYAHGFMEVFLLRHVESDLASVMQRDVIELTGLPKLRRVHAPYFCEASKDDMQP
jgi:hypothetical protein